MLQNITIQKPLSIEHLRHKPIIFPAQLKSDKTQKLILRLVLIKSDHFPQSTYISCETNRECIDLLRNLLTQLQANEKGLDW